jgi:NADP-dependent 3-hydroxy acid dehydrogenase YdfG
VASVYRKVTLITGALHGIEAAPMQGYRKHGWAVIANARSIPASDDAGVVTIAGDIVDPASLAP